MSDLTSWGHIRSENNFSALCAKAFASFDLNPAESEKWCLSLLNGPRCDILISAKNSTHPRPPGVVKEPNSKLYTYKSEVTANSVKIHYVLLCFSSF
mgnify:CR=1 FL=1